MGSVINRGTKERPSWYCKFRDLDGKWKQRATHQPTKALALRYVAEVEARIARGLVGVPEISDAAQRRASVTIAELAERFVADYNPPRLRDRARYMEQTRAVFNRRLLPFPIARMAAASVRKAHVVAFRDALRAAGYRCSTINEAVNKLLHLFNWALEAELIDCKNPVAHVELMPTKPSEERYSREQVQWLLDPKHRHPMVATALYTGMRKGELFGLTWTAIRFDLGCIDVLCSFDGPPKNGKTRVVPLHPELAPILREWQAQCPETPDRLVFPVRKRGRYRRPSQHDMENIRAILRAAGCPDEGERPWHAMRHTFTTLFIESGGSRDAVEQILGHSSRGNRITAGYMHLSVDYLAREMAKLTMKPTEPAKVYRLDAYRSHAG